MAIKVFRYISATTVLLLIVLIELMSQTSSPDTSDYLPDYYYNAIDYNLMIAASKGYDSEVIRLLEKGATTDYTTSEEASALIFAVANNRLSTTNLLLSAGFDANIATYKHETPLLIALFNNNFDIAETLIRHSANINYRDNFGAAPLHYAAFFGMTDICDLLLYYEADIDIRSNDGTTPLMVAIWTGNNAIAELLIKNGANMEATDNEGFTPFLIAAQSGNIDMLNYLKDNGVDIYEQNNYKWNALTLAIKTSATETIRELLSFGDGWTSGNKSQVSPSKIAAESGNQEVIELIEKSGLDGRYQKKIDQLSFSFSGRATNHGFYGGTSISFMEPVNHIGLSIGIDAKLWGNRVLYKESDVVFYQVRENGIIAYGGVVKEFPLTKRIDKFNLNATTALYAAYYNMGNIEGPPINVRNGLKLIPSVGIDYSSPIGGFFTSVEYQTTDFYGVGKLWTRFGFKFNIFFQNDNSPLKEIKWN